MTNEVAILYSIIVLQLLLCDRKADVMIKDLTTGKPERVLWKFTIPMFISVIFQQIYNIADSIIAGNYASENALAAVGASYPITMIFMAIAIGSNIGCCVVISNLFGAKKFGEMKTAISTTILTTIGLSTILTVLGLLGSKSLMRMLNTPSDIFKDGAIYLQIYIGGFIFLYLYNVCTGIFSSLGDSITPLKLLIGSSLGNIFLDLVFVVVFHWGVAGVAWATFIAQGIACILALLILVKRLRMIKLEKKPKIFSGAMLVKIATIAIPSILQQSFVSIGNIFIQRLINHYGSSIIAGYSAAIKLNTFAITSFTTLGNGLSSFTAQNIGANKHERVKRGYKAGILMATMVAVPFFVIYFLFSQSMIMLFMTNKGSGALKTGMNFLRIVTPFYFVICIKLIADGVLRGAQRMKEFMTSTFVDLILRVILAYVFSKACGLGTIGIWLSWPVGWTVAMVLSTTFYHNFCRKVVES